MSIAEQELLAERAKSLYERKWRADYERSHLHEFVAIEPDSESGFLGKTLSEAMIAAHKAFPGKPVYGIRIGHNAAVHMGVLW